MGKKTILSIVILLILITGIMGCNNKGIKKERVENDNSLITKKEIGEEKVKDEEFFDSKNFELKLGEKARVSIKDIKGLYTDDIDMLSFFNEFSGKKAPNFEMKNLNGDKVKISDFKGENVIIEFMGSWCSACTESIATNNTFNNEYKGARIISIGMDETKENLLELTETLGVKNVDFLLPESDEYLDLYNVYFVPIYFYIDSEGYIQMILKGNAPQNMLEEYSDKSFY